MSSRERLAGAAPTAVAAFWIGGVAAFSAPVLVEAGWPLVVVAAFCAAYLLLRRGRSLWRFELFLPAALALAIPYLYTPRGAIVVSMVFMTSATLGLGLLESVELRTGSGLRQFVLAAGIGIGGLMTAMFYLGLAGFYYPLVFIPMIFVRPLLFRRVAKRLMGLLREGRSQWASDPGCGETWAGVAAFFGIVCVLAALAATIPPSVAGEGFERHLPLARHYAEQHHLAAAPALDSREGPKAFAGLLTFPFGLGLQGGAQLFTPLLLLLSALAAAALARKLGASRPSALIVAVVSGGAPFVLDVATSGGSAPAVSLFCLLALLVYLEARSTGRPAWLRFGALYVACTAATGTAGLAAALPFAAAYIWQFRSCRRPLGELFFWSWVAAAVGGGWYLREVLAGLSPLNTAASVWPDALGMTDLPGAFFLVFAPAGMLFALQRLRPDENTAVIFAMASLGCAAVIDVLAGAAFFPLAVAVAVTVPRLEQFRLAGGLPRRALVDAALVGVLTWNAVSFAIGAIGLPEIDFLIKKTDREGYLRRALPPYAALAHLQDLSPEATVVSVDTEAALYAPRPDRFFLSGDRSLEPAEDAVEAAPPAEGQVYLLTPASSNAAQRLDAVGGSLRSQRLHLDGRFMLYLLRPSIDSPAEGSLTSEERPGSSVGRAQP